jgi:hypothetical protein
MTRFLIVTPFRDAGKFLSNAATRSLNQLYDDYRIVFIDDASSDPGYDIVQETIDRTATRCRDVVVVRNDRPIGLLRSAHMAILDRAEEDDVVLMLPACDSLLHRDALTVFDATFEREGSWVCFGGAVWNPREQRPFVSGGYTNADLLELRVPSWESWGVLQTKWRVHPPIAFRSQLYRKLETIDPQWTCLKDRENRFYDAEGDIAMMLPLLESAGAPRITHLRAKVCIHESAHETSDLSGRARMDIMHEIFAKPSFPKIDSLRATSSQQQWFTPSFVRPPRSTVGNGIHLSGWPYARQCLQHVRSSQPIVLDDFVEQSFCYGHAPSHYNRPWIGIFHHPPNVPEFAYRRHRLQSIFELLSWRDQAEWLQGGIALSEYLAAYLRKQLQVPVVVVKHPSEFQKTSWDEQGFRSQKVQQLVQIGFYLRNTRAIYQLPLIPGYRKVRLLSQDKPWVAAYEARVVEYWNRMSCRSEYGGVEEGGFLEGCEYERVLTESVVFTEVFDASANNVVIECILRSTPLVINRHPAVIEYLGKDYPLYFDDLDEVPGLLGLARILEANDYLREMDKRDLSGTYFTSAVARAIETVLSHRRDESLLVGNVEPNHAAPRESF